MRPLLVTALLVTAVTLSACVTGPSRGHGPPPHAPAHGYRHHHHGVDLVFDTSLGVYVVVGRSDHFYVDGRFLRFHADSWQVSASLGGPWSVYPAASVPPGLRKVHPSKAGRTKHKSHPAKGRW